MTIRRHSDGFQKQVIFQDRINCASCQRLLCPDPSALSTACGWRRRLPGAETSQPIRSALPELQGAMEPCCCCDRRATRTGDRSGGSWCCPDRLGFRRRAFLRRCSNPPRPRMQKTRKHSRPNAGSHHSGSWPGTLVYPHIQTTRHHTGTALGSLQS